MMSAARDRCDWLTKSIADAGQGEVDGEEVGFELFGVFSCTAAASKAFDWLNGGLGATLQ